jgi:ankyrin repeat protein
MEESDLPADRSLDDFFNEIICKRQVSKLRRVLAAHPGLINTPVNDQGWVLLVLAARANSLEFASVLVGEFNAKVDIRDNQGLTPLMHVVQSAGSNAQALAQYFCTTKANVHAKSKLRESALDMARGNETLAKMLTYFAANGPYSKSKWHIFKKLLWTNQTKQPWKNLSQFMVREACRFM